MKNLAYYGYQLTKSASAFAPNMTQIKPPQGIKPLFDTASPVNLPQSVQGTRASISDGGGLDGEIQQDQMTQEIQKQVEMQTKEQMKQMDDMKKQLDAAHKSMQAHQSEVARHQGEASRQREIADKVRQQANKELDAARNEKTKEMHAVHLDAHQARLEAARLAEEAKLHEAQISHLQNVHKMTQSAGDRSGDMPHVAQAQVDAFLGKVKGINGGLFKASAVPITTPPVTPPATPALPSADLTQKRMDNIEANQAKVPSEMQDAVSSGKTFAPPPVKTIADHQENLDKNKALLAGWHSSENPYDKTGQPNTEWNNPAYHIAEHSFSPGFKGVGKAMDMASYGAEKFVNMDPDYLQNQMANTNKFVRPLAQGMGWVGDKAMGIVRSPLQHVLKGTDQLGDASNVGPEGFKWDQAAKGVGNVAVGGFDAGFNALNPLAGSAFGLASDTITGDDRYDPANKVGVGYQSPEQLAQAQKSLTEARDQYSPQGPGGDLTKQPWYAQYMQHAGNAHPELLHHTLPGYAMMDRFRQQNPTASMLTSMVAPFLMPHVNYDKFDPSQSGQPDGNSEWARLQSTLPMMASGMYGG